MKIFIKEHSGFICKKTQESILLSERKPDKIQSRITSIPKHEAKLKTLCNPHQNKYI